MSALGVWSDEDIAYHAETCTELERKIICLCAERKTIGYRRLAERTSVTYAEAQRVGQLLRAANLANIQLLGHGYAGSGIFLNDNGQKLRLEILRRFP